MATPAARTASPGLLMLALLLTATSAPAKKPTLVGTEVHPQPVKHDAALATGESAEKVRCA